MNKEIVVNHMWIIWKRAKVANTLEITKFQRTSKFEILSFGFTLVYLCIDYSNFFIISLQIYWASIKVWWDLIQGCYFMARKSYTDGKVEALVPLHTTLTMCIVRQRWWREILFLLHNLPAHKFLAFTKGLSYEEKSYVTNSPILSLTTSKHDTGCSFGGCS